MPQQEGTSAFEHLTKNIFARIGTVATGVAGVATALHQLTHDITLTLEGLVLAIAIVACAFVLVWRHKKVEGDKEIVVFFYAKVPRLIAGALLLVAALFAIAYGVLVANLVIEREQLEKELAAIPFLTLTPHPTATPMPGAQQTATASARAAWSLILSDSFSSNANGWRFLGHSDFGTGNANRTIANGKYRFEVNSTTARISALDTPNLRSVSDMFVSTDAQRTVGPTSFGYGIYARLSADRQNAYLFYVTDDRDAVLLSLIDGKTIQLAHLSQVIAIKPGEVNRLGIVAQGSHLEAFVNDQLVTSIDDTRHKEGNAGFWVGNVDPGTQGVVEFSNLQVRTPAAPVTQAQATSIPPATATSTLLSPQTVTEQARINVTATALAQPTATKPAILAAVDALITNAKIAYAAGEGSTGGRAGGVVRCFNSGVSLRNFVAEAKLFNPADPKVNTWDYGFILREVGRNRQYWLVVNWDGTFRLFYPTLNPDGSRLGEVNYTRGSIKNWDASPTGSNQLRVVVNDKLGYFFVNNEFVSTLDVSEKNDQGNVGLCTAAYTPDDFSGLAVRFKDFIISSLP